MTDELADLTLASVNRFAPPSRITIAGVARHASVGKTTVSHVLSRSRTSHMVALVIPDITNPYHPVLARGLERAGALSRP